MTSEYGWHAETQTPNALPKWQMWHPVVRTSTGWYSMAVSFTSKEACEEFIATIPPGADS